MDIQNPYSSNQFDYIFQDGVVPIESNEVEQKQVWESSFWNPSKSNILHPKPLRYHQILRNDLEKAAIKHVEVLVDCSEEEIVCKVAEPVVGSKSIDNQQEFNISQQFNSNQQFNNQQLKARFERIHRYESEYVEPIDDPLYFVEETDLDDCSDSNQNPFSNLSQSAHDGHHHRTSETSHSHRHQDFEEADYDAGQNLLLGGERVSNYATFSVVDHPSRSQSRSQSSLSPSMLSSNASYFSEDNQNGLSNDDSTLNDDDESEFLMNDFSMMESMIKRSIDLLLELKLSISDLKRQRWNIGRM